MKKIIYIFFLLFFSSCYVQTTNTTPKPKKRIVIEYRLSNGGYWNTYPSPYYHNHNDHHRKPKNSPRR